MRLRTLVLIRWVAVVGQAFTILLVHHALGFALPQGMLLGAVALSALINLPLSIRRPRTTRLSERGAALLLAYDILQLSFLLALTGGLQNPFALLLLMPVTLSAATLSLGTTMLLALLVINVVTALALVPTSLPWDDPGFTLPHLYIFALWIAFVLGTCLIAAYAWRVTEEQRRMADALAATQMALAREQQLSALGGLAAAAAHELGSPLTTIAVTARELVKALPRDSELQDEAGELISQIQRCREILAQLGHEASHGAADHEPYTRAPFGDLLESLVSEFRRPGVDLQVTIDGEGEEPDLVLTPELRHALGNLIDNAVSFARTRVTLALRIDPHTVTLRIEDDGPGFAPEVLESLGEPYVSTRRGNGGLGLGVFIASTLLARTGANVRFDNRPQGAQVTVEWRPEAFEGFPRG
ncbi:ActS/PrrB/RegB family redox-sensitive histidine kinase [Marinivivus vitaminiproducens]|uniref:ActS/PrrB/RegB family redox-sensitive histidine kinase n=1 Tax=Marinivivus vitaminiproducens TaxID=3035935 RepID=UPI0027A763B7|nr:ActS/PrrB/RegB family redox-sensitive histidine kinase [Geminicoccaceae bacterium SCSIO 64248]